MTTAMIGIEAYKAGYNAAMNGEVYNPMASIAWRKGWYDAKSH